MVKTRGMNFSIYQMDGIRSLFIHFLNELVYPDQRSFLLIWHFCRPARSSPAYARPD